MDDEVDEALIVDERYQELSAIKAIYDELAIDPLDPFHATLEIPISPVSPLPISFKPMSDGAPPILPPTPPESANSDADTTHDPKVSTQPDTVDVHYLEHLPPLNLDIRLPEGYPTHHPPSFRLSTQYHWLPRGTLHKLEIKGKDQWEIIGRDQIVYDYIDDLRTAGDEVFGFSGSGTPFSLPQALKIALLDFDIKAKRAIFEKGTFECGVCLEPKKGNLCYKLQQCGHVFCMECLRDYYNNCIQGGEIDNVKCLAPDCGKQVETEIPEKKRHRNHPLSPSELLQISLQPDVVQRYVKLRRKKKLESDPSTIYCPRQWCQGPARAKKHPQHVDDDFSDSESIEQDPQEPPSKKDEEFDPLCICEDCGYAFCCVCKNGWHGQFGKCIPFERRAELTEEEKASEEYMKLHTSPCPTCNAPSQKTHGCNHMICFRCNTHFCYLCSAWLDPGNPYQHFNDPKCPCYMRLWELEGGDGGEAIDLGFAGGQEDIPAELIDSDDGDDFVAASESDPDSEDDEPPRPPPPAPNPPQGPNANNPPNQDRGQPVGHPRVLERNFFRPPRRADRGIDNAENGQLRRHGIQRFLQLAINDEEDEWDSDEIEDEFEWEEGRDENGHL
ncbi:MAG: translation termination inhibitor protein itt1 [Cirrosporium novae-zelandiae]|nr:MAG: translation termination inhibitor protein itt1 [Cirrosporium novae-zelandiae]